MSRALVQWRNTQRVVRDLGIGGDTWQATHADGAAATLTPIYVLQQAQGGGAQRMPEVATPGAQSISQWWLYAPPGTDVRPGTVIASGSLRFIVLDVQQGGGVLVAALQELQFFYTADLYRSSYDPATNSWSHSQVLYRDVEVSIFPGGRIEVTDSSTGTVGAKDSYTGFCPLTVDVRINDQFRNVRNAARRLYQEDSRYGDGAHFIVGTVARWPAIIALRMTEYTQ